jgi:hypothetical protein
MRTQNSAIGTVYQSSKPTFPWILKLSELNKRPGIQQIRSEIKQRERPIRRDREAGRMLHESVCDQDKKAGKPAAGGNTHRCQEVVARTESLLSPDQRADERALEKEGEHSFHCQCLANDRASILGEAGPVGPKLKFHRNAGYYSDREI